MKAVQILQHLQDRGDQLVVERGLTGWLACVVKLSGLNNFVNITELGLVTFKLLLDLITTHSMIGPDSRRHRRKHKVVAQDAPPDLASTLRAQLAREGSRRDNGSKSLQVKQNPWRNIKLHLRY